MIAQLNGIAQIWWQWMGSMFWQVGLLIAIITVLDMFLRKWAWPQVRYAMWALVFIKLIISPAWQMPTSIVSWIQPQVGEQVTFKFEMSEKIEKGSVNFVTPDEDNIAPVIAEQVSWKSFALLAWLSGVVVFAFMLLKKMYKFGKMNRVENKTVIPEWFNELMIKTAARLKLSKTPSVVLSEDAKSPAVYGVFRPVLLLPDGYLDKLSNEQAEHVLMHELCHLKRGDLLVHWFCIVVQIVYWFNPLLIWTRRQMRHVCEICCDLSVANVLREKTASYRETLLHSARELFAENMQPSLGLFGIFEEPFRLVPRLKWLEKRSWENRRKRVAVTICTSLFMVFCVMPMACIEQAPASLNTEITEQQTEDEISNSQQIVSLEALVIEVDFDKEFKVGAKWVTTPQGVEWTGKPPEMETLLGDSSLAPLLTGVIGDDITINGESYYDIGQVFRDMRNEPGIIIISNPQIMVLNGKQADMSISDNEIDNSEFLKKLSMKVTPTIEQDDMVKLQLELTYSKQLDDAPAPTTFKREINTTVKIKGGQTVIIGGLLVANNDKEKSPTDKKNLYVFLTSRIIGQEQGITTYPGKISAKNEINNGNPVAEGLKRDEKTGRWDLDFKDTDITTVLKSISEAADKNIIWDYAIQGRKITELLKDVSLDEALDIILKNNRLAKKNAGENVIWVTTKEKMKEFNASLEAASLKESTDIKVSKRADKEERLNLKFDDIDVTEALRTICHAAKINMIFDPAIYGRKVTMVLNDKPWEEALDLILKNNGLEKREIYENTFSITTSEKMKEITETIKAKETKLKSPGTKSNTAAQRTSNPIPARTISLRKELIKDALSDLQTLLTQASIRPYFSEGQPDGLAISGIKAGSIFRKMGFRNGDIVKSVKGNDIKSPEDLISLYNYLQSEDNDTVTYKILRRGRERIINLNFN